MSCDTTGERLIAMISCTEVAELADAQVSKTCIPRVRSNYGCLLKISARILRPMGCAAGRDRERLWRERSVATQATGSLHWDLQRITRSIRLNAHSDWSKVLGVRVPSSVPKNSGASIVARPVESNSHRKEVKEFGNVAQCVERLGPHGLGGVGQGAVGRRRLAGLGAVGLPSLRHLEARLGRLGQVRLVSLGGTNLGSLGRSQLGSRL